MRRDGGGEDAEARFEAMLARQAQVPRPTWPVFGLAGPLGDGQGLLSAWGATSMHLDLTAGPPVGDEEPWLTHVELRFGDRWRGPSCKVHTAPAQGGEVMSLDSLLASDFAEDGAGEYPLPVAIGEWREDGLPVAPHAVAGELDIDGRMLPAQVQVVGTYGAVRALVVGATTEDTVVVTVLTREWSSPVSLTRVDSLDDFTARRIAWIRARRAQSGDHPDS